MNATTSPHPIALLAATERALLEQLGRAAAAVAAIGTSDLDRAVALLREETAAAHARLSRAAEMVRGLGAALLEDLEQDLTGLEHALDANDQGDLEVPLEALPAVQVPQLASHAEVPCPEQEEYDATAASLDLQEATADDLDEQEQAAQALRDDVEAADRHQAEAEAAFAAEQAAPPKPRAKRKAKASRR